MDTKRLVVGSVAGGVVIAVLGFLVWEVALAGFFETQMSVAAREAPVVWAAVLSALTHGLLLTLVVGWTGSRSLGAGFKTGALVGLLVWLGADMILYGALEFSTLAGALTDTALGAVQYGIAGAAIAAVAGSGVEEAAPAAPVSA